MAPYLGKNYNPRFVHPRSHRARMEQRSSSGVSIDSHDRHDRRNSVPAKYEHGDLSVCRSLSLGHDGRQQRNKPYDRQQPDPSQATQNLNTHLKIPSDRKGDQDHAHGFASGETANQDPSIVAIPIPSVGETQLVTGNRIYNETLQPELNSLQKLREFKLQLEASRSMLEKGIDSYEPKSLAVMAATFLQRQSVSTTVPADYSSEAAAEVEADLDASSHIEQSGSILRDSQDLRVEVLGSPSEPGEITVDSDLSGQVGDRQVQLKAKLQNRRGVPQHERIARQISTENGSFDQAVTIGKKHDEYGFSNFATYSIRETSEHSSRNSSGRTLSLEQRLEFADYPSSHSRIVVSPARSTVYQDPSRQKSRPEAPRDSLLSRIGDGLVSQHQQNALTSPTKRGYGGRRADAHRRSSSPQKQLCGRRSDHGVPHRDDIQRPNAQTRPSVADQEILTTLAGLKAQIAKSEAQLSTPAQLASPVRIVQPNCVARPYDARPHPASPYKSSLPRHETSHADEVGQREHQMYSSARSPVRHSPYPLSPRRPSNSDWRDRDRRPSPDRESVLPPWKRDRDDTMRRRDDDRHVGYKVFRRDSEYSFDLDYGRQGSSGDD
ncbi:hypothetical protein BD324DRAFT_640471, partial [Kockovaella imperatae]